MITSLKSANISLSISTILQSIPISFYREIVWLLWHDETMHHLQWRLIPNGRWIHIASIARVGCLELEDMGRFNAPCRNTSPWGECGMSGMTSKLIDGMWLIVIHLQEQSYKQTQDYAGNWYNESVRTLSGIGVDDYSIAHSHKGLNSSILSFHPAWLVESTSRESEINKTYCFIVAVSCAVAKHEQSANDIKIST